MIMVFLITMKNIVNLLLLLNFFTAFSQSYNGQLEDLFSDYERTRNNQTDSALIYINRAYKIAMKLNNSDWLAKTTYGLGYCYYLKGNDTISFYYSKKAIKHAKKVHNDDVLSRAYTQVGNLYALKNNYSQALKELYKSLKISEKNDSLYDNTILTLTYIGDILVTEKDTIKALENYHKAKYLGEKKSSKRLDRVYSSLGVLYMGTEKDSALLYFKNSLLLYQSNKHMYGEIHSRINIAATILNFKSVNDYPLAFNQLLLANSLAEKYQNKDVLFFTNYFFGVYYETVQKDLLKAKKHYEKSMELIKDGYKNEYIIQLYKSLSRISMKQGDYKTAYELHVKFQQLQDSIFSIEKNKHIHEIQTKFDVEQKNNRIKLLNKENEIKSKQNLWIFITAIILVIFLIIIAYIYRKEARSQKVIRKQDLLLFQKQKESIENQQKLNEIKFLITGQNQERSRVSKELHDGIGSSLAAMKINLSLLNEREVKNKQLNYHINQLNDITKEIRIISHALSIGTDSVKSMVELINDLVEIHQLNKDFRVHLTLFPEDCLDGLAEFEKTSLYRVFQEVFANISRHSQATKVAVNCIRDDANLTIMIEDNGVGFGEGDHSGIGLKNIKERIKELKGEVSIDSVPNHGTTISISLSKNKQE